MLLKNSPKWRYMLFIIAVIITIIVDDLIVQNNIDRQLADAKTINLAGRQRMLSQKIAKQVLYIQYGGTAESHDSLRKNVQTWQKTHEFLKNNQSGIQNNTAIDSLFVQIDPNIKVMVMASQDISESSSSLSEAAIHEIREAEEAFLIGMDAIVLQYQKISEAKLRGTKRIVLIISIFSILLLIVEFIGIITPLFNSLKKQNLVLDRKNRHLSDFAQITSHNLRSPVSNIRSLLDIYRMTENAEEKKDIMEKMQVVVDRLNETMDSLLDALKTHHGEVGKTDYVSLDAILADTLKSLSPALEASKGRVEGDFSALEGFHSNKLYMESIFLNLISNAVKYRSPERDLVIVVTSKRVKNRPTLTISDNGLGIDLERQGDKIFGLGKTFHRHPEARGVGLFMTRNQIESLGGSIQVSSTVNEGTTFTLTF